MAERWCALGESKSGGIGMRALERVISSALRLTAGVFPAYAAPPASLKKLEGLSLPLELHVEVDKQILCAALTHREH